MLCIDNFSTGVANNVRHLLGNPDFHLMRGDVTDSMSVEGRVDAVLHFASPASPPDYLRLPVETLKAGSLGTLQALALAKDKGARFLLASTSEVYGDPLIHPQPEEYWGHANPVGPRAVYDEAKRFAEAATTAYRDHHGVDTGIVRIFNTFGPRMRARDGRVIPTFIGQALSGVALTVTGDGEQTRSLCYVDDLVEGVHRLLESGHPGPVNLGNPQELTVLQLSRLVKELTGSRSATEFVPRPQDDPLKRRPDITLARQVLGWEPKVTVEEGLMRTIEWFRHPRTTESHTATPCN